ncbi:tetratricopeptide repeat protein [Derxia gummosa]|uniref:Tetratricopeptide repeat protein n=1 Tax=Derxia gummosa DSM 723 TaxID=1121388 RepID=A0A8B6X6A6_9BURK|nr:tetratricopeptide repeat protein [Derxia gummosa]
MREPELKFEDCRVLLVDDSAVARQVCEALLRDIGLRRITSVGRLTEARRAVETMSYDLVICDFLFDHEPSNGQELLEEWRRLRTLPFMSVFIMVTGESKYLSVAEALGSAIDDYLLKPFTAKTLAERITLAHRRKLALAPVLNAIEQRDHEGAVRICEQLLAEDSPHRGQLARLCVELHLKLGRKDDARRQLAQICAGANPPPWAKLARLQLDLEQGDLPGALAGLEKLIAEHPDHGDTWDVLARARYEQGSPRAALAVMQRAVEATPGSVTRLQKLGWLALLCDEPDTAREALARAVRVGSRSRLLDGHSVLLLMCLLADKGNARELRRARDQWQRIAGRQPPGRRQRRFEKLIEVLYAFSNQQAETGALALGVLADELRDEDADFEFACDFARVLMRVIGRGAPLPEVQRWAEVIGLRFATTRADTDMLARILADQPALAEVVRQAHAAVARRCQDAMSRLVQGSPAETVELLFETGRRSRNAKPLDMARRVIARHVADAPELAETDARIADFMARHCGEPRLDLGIAMPATRVVAGVVLDD